MRLTFAVTRWNPETDIHYHEEDYRLEVSRGMTVLDALIRIKNEQDGTLSLRYSCRSAICGSCAMEINGTEKLACRTSVRKEWERHGQIAVAPLRNLPVITDVGPLEAIIRLRRATIGAGLVSSGGARHVTGFADIVEREGRLNEALMPLKIARFNLRRMLSVIPLGIKMFVKGKIPNPFARPI